ncbi:lipase PAD4 [Trifolium repens]|nr:lipase PAD4 [Trifolium repens]
MTSPKFGKLVVQVSDKEKSELFTAVMDYVDAATQNGEVSGSILFHPFGSYLFVTEEGALCIDSPVTIIKMMHLLLSTSSPSGSIEDHLKYGLELAIESSGIANQESSVIPAKECLKSARRMGPSPALNAASLALKLSKVVPYRAQIEWYKSWCDEQDNEMGYYDFFKTRGAVKRDMKNKEVSCDVLAKNSSYSTWVEDLKEMKQLRANVQRYPQQFTRFLDGVVP